MKASPAFQQAENRRFERRRAREGRGDKPLSMYIRVAESDLYDWDVTSRSILKEIAYLAVKDVGDEDKKVRAARATPINSPYKDYEGWCWAKQDYLAERVGCDEKTVCRKLGVMEEDCVVIVRSYKTRRAEDGYAVEHHEYRINDEMVDAHQRTGKRKPKGRKPGTKAFKKSGDKSVGHKATEVTAGHLTSGQAVTLRGDSLSPHEVTRYPSRGDSVSPKVCSSGLSFEVDLKERSDSATPAPAAPGSVAVATLQHQKTKAKPEEVRSLEAERQRQKQNPEAACKGHRAALGCASHGEIKKLRETMSRCGKCKAVAMGLNEDDYSFYRHPVDTTKASAGGGFEHEDPEDDPIPVGKGFDVNDI